MLILGFLLLGFGFFLFFVASLYINEHFNEAYNYETFFYVVAIGNGINLFIVYQLIFTCKVLPFILVSLAYHNFLRCY